MTSLRLPKEPRHHLLRLAALTPANCGDVFGSAAVDRPVSVDAWRALPYLPSSALKGVLAGRRGNVRLKDGTLHRHRTEVFGAPDPEDLGEGKISQVVFGDGDPLAFPILLEDGRRAWVIVAETVYRLARWGFLTGADPRPVESPLAFESTVTARELPPLAEILRPATFGIEPGLLRWLIGVERDPLLVAAPEASRVLWLAALEERTLTALESDRRVKAGSLRTVELIPAGSLFLSVVSHFLGQEVDLGPAAPLQLGAWESCGMGYFEARRMEGPLGLEKAERLSGDESGRRSEAFDRRPDHQVMVDVFEAVSRLAERPEAGRARSAIFDLGPRLSQQGLEATLAFCLAKAGGAKVEDGTKVEDGAEKLKTEQLAYRFVLSRLLGKDEGISFDELHRRVVRTITTGELPGDFELNRTWLRRYAEVLLPREKENA